MKNVWNNYATIPFVLAAILIVFVGRFVLVVEQAAHDVSTVEMRPALDIEVVVLPGANDEEAVLLTDLLGVGAKVPMPPDIFADYIRGREEQITLFVRISDDVRYVAERDLLTALRAAGVPMVVSYAEQEDCAALLNTKPRPPVVQPAVEAVPAAKTKAREPQYRRDARMALAVAGVVNEMGRGLQRHPHPFVALTAATARQVAVRVQVAAMADLDMISHNPVVAMGQGFLIGF